MIIEVTEQDIKDGVSNSDIACPIALAVRHSIECNSVEVSPEDIVIDGSLVMINTVTMRNFIRRFDRGLSVEPFNFNLELDKLEEKW